MKSDYLWDRTGSDAEVEGLEHSLSGLAFDADPPELPVAEPLRLPTRPSPPLGVKVPAWATRTPWLGGRLTPLAFAIGLTLVGFGIAWSAIQKERLDVRKGWNLVPVLVANVDLSEGTVVTPETLSQRSVPEQFVTPSVVKPDSAQILVGQRLQVPVAAGDPLQWTQFDTARAAERLAARVFKRARALAVDVKGTTSVGGWLQPNDHVDVIGSFKDPSTHQQVAVTLMQNVPVLSTGKLSGSTKVNLLSPAERTYGNVSLLVLPEEAELLTLGAELGTLTFTLRNETDLTVLDERGRASVSSLLSGERTRVLQQKRFSTIQVIRGTKP